MLSLSDVYRGSPGSGRYPSLAYRDPPRNPHVLPRVSPQALPSVLDPLIRVKVHIHRPVRLFEIEALHPLPLPPFRHSRLPTPPTPLSPLPLTRDMHPLPSVPSPLASLRGIQIMNFLLHEAPPQTPAMGSRPAAPHTQTAAPPPPPAASTIPTPHDTDTPPRPRPRRPRPSAAVCASPVPPHPRFSQPTVERWDHSYLCL